MKSVEVATRADVNPTHYSRLENGRVNPSWAMVRRVANALGMRVSELAAQAEQIFANIDTKGGFPAFEDVDGAISRLELALYSPLKFVLPQHQMLY